MKKSRQIAVNNVINDGYRNMLSEWIYGERHYIGRLRRCHADIWESPDYYYLMSYTTIVAFIDKSDLTCYDVLRKVYGFTRTSAQHIDKFSHDYGATNRMTYYPIG